MKNIFYAGLMAVALAFMCGGARGVDVNVSSSPPDSFAVGVTVTFNANATNVDEATVYTWTFDEALPGQKDKEYVVVGSQTITHVFNADDVYVVYVKVNNGRDPVATDFIIVEAIKVPPATDPDSTDLSDPDLKTVTNPDNGIGFTLDTAKSGYISGSLSSGATSVRGNATFETDFGDTVGGRSGNVIQHHYADAGVFVLTSVRSENGSETGKIRKTLAFSEKDINGAFADPNVVDLPVTDRKFKFKNFKAKFGFKKTTPTVRSVSSKPDSVTVSWSMNLPAGFNNNGQSVDLAIGNVMDTVALDKSGKGTPEQGSNFKSVRFKLPRMKKGQTNTTAPFSSTVSVSMSGADLTGSGFDTEGISPRESEKTLSKGPFSRKIQVAVVIDGVAYTGTANVGLTVDKNSEFGSCSIGRN